MLFSIVIATRNGATLDVTVSADIIEGPRAFAILHDSADIATRLGTGDVAAANHVRRAARPDASLRCRR